MSSLRVLFCDLCIILLFGHNYFLVEARPDKPPAVDDGPKGNCTCGGFPSDTIDVNDVPLLSQTPGLIVKCDTEGESTCKNLCNALGIATKAKGPEVLCNRLTNANELKLSAFAKVCELPWVYADLTADEPLCCEDSKVLTCPSVEKINATDKAEAKTVV